jgi:hypothetical protein
MAGIFKIIKNGFSRISYLHLLSFVLLALPANKSAGTWSGLKLYYRMHAWITVMMNGYIFVNL